MRKFARFTLLSLAPVCLATAQDNKPFTRADTLRGSITPERAWWDVAFYDLHVAVNPADSSVRGYNGITYRVLQPAQEMQIDLMVPLEIDSVMQAGRKLRYRRDGNAYFVTLASAQRAGDQHTVVAYYHGRPRVAERAPWDGGVVWGRDSLGGPFIATAVQGFGASGWWPNKDTQADEPDSQRVAITVPSTITDVSNGRLRSTTPHPNGTTTYEWFVANPINNYNVAVNAATYTHLSDVYAGENGLLTMDFYPLAFHADAAKKQFQQATTMLRCFERWFGPYPWYEDGYKLVETPHLGMEHQSAVAYGNHYNNGYLGRDLSGTGWGLMWDFIIVHESAHEWWGNNITSKDVADMWVHESFANYSENLYTECLYGKQAGATYVIGTRKGVQNDRPVVGPFGVQKQGSGDMYPKGGNMLHTIRQIVGDDEKWRGILRGLNKTFWHQTVTGKQVQDYISQEAGVDLSTVFAQYLTTTRIPVFEYRVAGTTLQYRWADVVPGFHMPLRVSLTGGAVTTLTPTTTWQSAPGTVPDARRVRVDDNYYVVPRDVTPLSATSALPPAGGGDAVRVNRSVARDLSPRLRPTLTLAARRLDRAPANTLAPRDDDDDQRDAPERTVRPPSRTPSGSSSVEQTTHGAKPGATLIASFDGLGEGFTGPQGSAIARNPSDNTLAVGPDHIVQIVNSRMAIFTKKGRRFAETGTALYGPVGTNNVFKGFGGPCEARPNGDAVARYDQLANRWLIVMPIFRRSPKREREPTAGEHGEPARRSLPGQLRQPGAAVRLYQPAAPLPAPPSATQPGADQRPTAPPDSGSYGMCYALSTGSDPLGSYYRYEFVRPLFPDYPRPAVWPDGYYVPTSTSDDLIQKHACVVDRAKMLRGQNATEQCIIIDGVNFLNNADLDGTQLPPKGAPNIMLAAGGTQLHKVMVDDGIYAWSFHVDWKDSSKTRIEGPTKITVAPYHYLCDGQLTSCVPQPGTDRRLDAQGDKIMARVVYRRIGRQESVVATHSVNTASGGGGVRWYELRVQPDRRLVLEQQGTYAPDSLFRWMASPAMDARGNIGIGYSFGGTPHFAGQRFAGRLAGDPKGTLTLRETVLVEGEAAQTNTLRWQDYTQTAVDPSDDCTIWYVGDYLKAGATNYSTKIGAFRMEGCGGRASRPGRASRHRHGGVVGESGGKLS